MTRGFPSLDFSQLRALAFNSVIVATSAWRGKWNKHVVAPFDNFFYAGAIFFIFEKNAKNENRLCPPPYEEVLEDIFKTVWTEQCGNLEELRYLGMAALVCPW